MAGLLEQPPPRGLLDLLYQSPPPPRHVALVAEALMNARPTYLEQRSFKPGEQVSRSGIYRVIHDKNHSHSHEVTCVKGEPFPTCRGCGDHPRFVLVRPTIHLSESEWF